MTKCIAGDNIQADQAVAHQIIELLVGLVNVSVGPKIVLKWQRTGFPSAYAPKPIS